jgi:Flp pilus assembly protein TadD
MADVHLARENTAAAETMLRTLVQEAPSDPRPQHALALLLESTGRVGEAKPLFESAAKLQPEDPLYVLSEPDNDVQPASSSRSDNSGFDGRSDSATADSRGRRAALISIAKTVKARDRVSQSLALLDAGDEGAAARVILTAMDVEPQNRQLPLEYSIYALRTGRASAATATLEGASRRFPNSPELLRALAVAHLEGGNAQAAQVVLQQALSLDNANALSYFLLGQVLRQQGRTAEANQAFARAQKLDRRYTQR